MRFWTPNYSWQLRLGLLAFKKELHRLGKLTLLWVSASAEKPRVAAKTGGPVRSRDKGPSHKPKQKVKVRSGVRTGGPRLHCKNLSWGINRWENSMVFSMAFSLSTNEYLPLAPKNLIPYFYPHLCSCLSCPKRSISFHREKLLESLSRILQIWACDPCPSNHAKHPLPLVGQRVVLVDLLLHWDKKDIYSSLSEKWNESTYSYLSFRYYESP